MSRNKNPQFSSQDFYLAAFLVVNGLQLIGVERGDPRRILFIFGDTEERKDLIEDFLFGRTMVEPKAFIAAIKELKQLLHSNT